ncbi:MAG: inverse autotransporter beta domain-containing protein [Rhizobiales bacterium]|nr:inverse autotransporter beta domain-containing protein [Hyphomicrobiales bacterium]
MRLQPGVADRARWAALNGTAPALLAVLMAAHPAIADPGKWGAHLDFEGRWGNARSLGDAGLFAPLWQNQTSLLFTDLRGRLDSQDGQGNFGLGYRHMLTSGWNLGVYGYYDVRRTSFGNMFNQVALGAEMLSADWDLRTNLYAPFGARSRQIALSGGGNPFAEFANDTIQIVTPGLYQLVERALTGFDGEIGWRAPVFDVDALTQLRLYGGGFYFDGGGVTRDIAGPRGRIEFSIDDVAGFSGARLTLGAEVQRDDVRRTQGFAVARLRVPLQAEKAPPRLSAQERRMTERVVRDVDIVSATGRGPRSRAEIREAAIDTWNGKTVTGVVQAAPAAAVNLQVQLDAMDAGSIVILNGAPILFGETTVKAGQTLIGGGTTLALRGATTGAAVNFIAPGAPGNLTGPTLMAPVVGLGAGSVVGGLTIGNTAGFASNHAIQAVDANGAVIFGNTIMTQATTGNGIYVSNSRGVTISGNQFGAIGGNVINAANGSSFTPASAGNSVTGPVGGTRCGGDGTASGTVSFAAGADCTYP